MAKVHKRKVMDGEGIELALRRMAQEVIEANKGLANVALIGIADGGIPVCDRLHDILAKSAKNDIPTGMIDITLYRDDLTINDQPQLKSSRLEFNIDDKNVVLVDDVIFTGRSVRAAITALMDYGRPRRIQLAVLVDRGHRELPIQADFIGRHIDTSIDEKVVVAVGGEANSKQDKVITVTPIEQMDEEE